MRANNVLKQEEATATSSDSKGKRNIDTFIIKFLRYLHSKMSAYHAPIEWFVGIVEKMFGKVHRQRVWLFEGDWEGQNMTRLGMDNGVPDLMINNKLEYIKITYNA